MCGSKATWTAACLTNPAVTQHAATAADPALQSSTCRRIWTAGAWQPGHHMVLPPCRWVHKWQLSHVPEKKHSPADITTWSFQTFVPTFRLQSQASAPANISTKHSACRPLGCLSPSCPRQATQQENSQSLIVCHSVSAYETGQRLRLTCHPKPCKNCAHHRLVFLPRLCFERPYGKSMAMVHSHLGKQAKRDVHLAGKQKAQTGCQKARGTNSEAAITQCGRAH